MRFQCASGPFRNGLFGEKGVLLKPKNLFSAFPEMSVPRVSGHSTVYLPEQGLENTKGKNACSLKFLDFWVSCSLRLQSKKMGSENLTITDFQSWKVFESNITFHAGVASVTLTGSCQPLLAPSQGQGAHHIPRQPTPLWISSKHSNVVLYKVSQTFSRDLPVQVPVILLGE